MSKTTMTAALAVAMALAMPVAYAQTHSTTPAASERTEAKPLALHPGQIRGSEMIGSTVYDNQNRNIGTVKDVILDRSGRVDNVILDVGAFLGIGGKYVAVPMNDLKMVNDNNRVRWTTSLTEEQLQAAHAVDLGTTQPAGAGTSTQPSNRSSATAPSSPPRQ